MGLIKHIAAPIRRLVRFPLFQLAVVVALILWLQAADETSAAGYIFSGLDKLVDATVQLFSAILNVRAFTKSWLTSGFWIGYVYLACLLILFLARIAVRFGADLAGQHNALWLRNTIARERGITAYRAWVPLEKIRPPNVPQLVWEERFAWPADNKPPYPPFAQRVTIAAISNVAVALAVAGLLQAFTPFPVLTWLGHLAKAVVG